METLTTLIQRAGDGDAGAKDELFAVAYPELLKLAHARLRKSGRSALLETTALVHEAYLRFTNAGHLRADNRKAFFCYASRVMRSIIIDEVRGRQARRRGGDVEMLTLNTELSASVPSPEAEILGVHEALQTLEHVEPRLAQVAEMRYFAGYSEDEIAEAIGVTTRTVGRDWEKARLLLTALLKS